MNEYKIKAKSHQQALEIRTLLVKLGYREDGGDYRPHHFARYYGWIVAFADGSNDYCPPSDEPELTFDELYEMVYSVGKKFSVGDKVYSPQHGTGIYTLQQGYSVDYPLAINNVEALQYTYTEQGMMLKSETLPVIFHVNEGNRLKLNNLYGVEFDKVDTPERKEIIISWNEDVGFYCEEFSGQLFYYVLEKVATKYSLITPYIANTHLVGETWYYLSIRELNKEHYDIRLQEEDGSAWVFG